MRVGVSGKTEVRKAAMDVVWEKNRMRISEQQSDCLKPPQREGKTEVAW